MSNVALSADLIAPILSYITQQGESIDPAILACSLVSKLWRSQTLPVMFTKIELVAKEPDECSLAKLLTFLDFVDIHPEIGLCIQTVHIRIVPQHPNVHTGATALYHDALGSTLARLAAGVSNVQRLTIAGDNWANNLRFTSREAIRVMCTRPSLQHFRDEGMSVPLSVWIYNPNITSVELVGVQIHTGSIMLEQQERPEPMGSASLLVTNITRLAVVGGTDLDLLRAFPGQYMSAMKKLRSLSIEAVAPVNQPLTLEPVAMFLRSLGNSLIELDLRGTEILSTFAFSSYQ